MIFHRDRLNGASWLSAFFLLMCVAHSGEVSIFHFTRKTIEVSTEDVSGGNFNADEKNAEVVIYAKLKKVGVVTVDTNKSLRAALSENVNKNGAQPFSGEEAEFLCKDESNDEWIVVSMMTPNPDFVRYAKLTSLTGDLFYCTGWRKSSKHQEFLKQMTLFCKNRTEEEKLKR